MALTIHDLPDDFMLSVFKFLNINEKLKVTRVCKKWYNYIHDPSLWQILDLKQYKRRLNLYNLKSVLQIYGTNALHELYLNGNYDELKRYDFNNDLDTLYYLDESFMNTLVSNCNNLRILSFEYLNLYNLKLTSFSFEILKELTFKWCYLTLFPKQLQKYPTTQLTSIQTLNLIRLNQPLKQYDVEMITKLMPNLINLTINESKSSFNDDCVKYLLNLFKLEKLELINTQLTDAAVSELTKSVYLKMNLKHLNLSMNSKLTNLSLELIGTNFYELKFLYLTSCFGFTTITHLETLTKLQYLNVNNTSIEKKFVLNFLLKFASCEVEYNHEKILNRKFNWTINGSKNCVCSF